MHFYAGDNLSGNHFSTILESYCSMHRKPLARGGDFQYLAIVGYYHSHPAGQIFAPATGHSFGGTLKGEQISWSYDDCFCLGCILEAHLWLASGEFWKTPVYPGYH